MLVTAHNAEPIRCHVSLIACSQLSCPLSYGTSTVFALQKQPRGGQGNITVAKTKTATHRCVSSAYTLKARYMISNVQAGLVTVIPRQLLHHLTLSTKDILGFLYQIIRKNSPSGWKSIIEVIQTMLWGVKEFTSHVQNCKELWIIYLLAYCYIGIKHRTLYL